MRSNLLDTRPKAELMSEKTEKTGPGGAGCKASDIECTSSGYDLWCDGNSRNLEHGAIAVNMLNELQNSTFGRHSLWCINGNSTYFKKQQVKAKPKVSNKPSEMKQDNKPALRTIK